MNDRTFCTPKKERWISVELTAAEMKLGNSFHDSPTVNITVSVNLNCDRATAEDIMERQLTPEDVINLMANRK